MPRNEKKPPFGQLAAAVPGAIGAILLVGAVAFGASNLRSLSTLPEAAPTAKTDTAGETGTTAAAGEWSEVAHDPKVRQPKENLPKDAPKHEKADEKADTSEEFRATSTPVAKPQPPQPTLKPMPAGTKKPSPKPAPQPDKPVALALEAWTRDGKVKLAWKPYKGEGFEYYKVVRSADPDVRWPAGGNDSVIGVIGDPTAPWHLDKPACGTAWYYRVFAVRHGDGGYVRLAASNAAKAKLDCSPEPTPVEVKPLGFELKVKPGEGIKLVWAACHRDGFVAYKVVRSQTNDDPRLPLNAGAELIAVIGDAGQTTFLDADVEAGETWTYRVVAVTKNGSGYVQLCETAAAAATAQ